MTTTQTANQVLDREFLDVRHRIIDVAATLDRIEGGEGADSTRSDPRMVQLTEAIRSLIDGKPKRAERVQMIFSDSYEPNWRAPHPLPGH